MNPQTDIYIILGIVAGVLVLLALRELFCWYFKINQKIKLLEENNRLLKKLVNLEIRSQPDYNPDEPSGPEEKQAA